MEKSRRKRRGSLRKLEGLVNKGKSTSDNRRETECGVFNRQQEIPCGWSSGA